MALLVLLAEGAAHAAEHGTEKSGLPQLAFETYAGQLFWLAVCFTLLFVLLWRVALPRIGRVIEGRAAQIESDFDKAKAFQAKAEATVRAYETETALARSKARGQIEDLRTRLKAENETRRKGAEEKLARDLIEAEKRIARMRDDALAGLKEAASSAAAAVVQRLSGEAPAQGAIDAAVDAALKA